MPEFLQLQTTLPDRDSAVRLADRLVRERVAACVHVSGPVTSLYWWREAVESASEWLCVAKVRRDDWKAAEAIVREVHPYEVPELVAVAIEAVSADYATWLVAETERT